MGRADLRVWDFITALRLSKDGEATSAPCNSRSFNEENVAGVEH